MNTKNAQVSKMVTLAILTATVIVLQYLSGIVHLGPFNITLALIPITIGAVLCSYSGGLWLGTVYGAVVLLSGQAALFIQFSLWRTIVIVMTKGILCGFFSALIYRTLRNFNHSFATIASAVICPVANTGIFVLLCKLLFTPLMVQWGSGKDVWSYIIIFVVGINFLVEAAVSIVCSPLIIRLMTIREKIH